MAHPADRIRELNDEFRARGPSGGDWFVTPGVQALGDPAVLLALSHVQARTEFTTETDPYREHDFGRFELAGETLYWKIDYYDPDLIYGSADPGDPDITRRVMTILLASEY